MMRIITGTARGVHLDTLDGDNITRPTGEKVKEAVFSMLQFDIEGRNVLDLFAGSGQLGLEALSRGAVRATFVDSDAGAVNIIKRNAQKTKLYEKCRVLNTDFRKFIKGAAKREKFDIIFIDPPYDSDMVSEAIELIQKNDILSDNGIIICESDRKDPFEADGMNLLRHNKYGRVYITLLTAEGENEDEESTDSGNL